jgi:hypothetical protein
MLSTQGGSPRVQRQLDIIETLDDQTIRRTLAELAGSMFLAMSLHTLDRTPLPVDGPEDRKAEALTRIPDLTEAEALGVLVSMAGLTCTGKALAAVTAS